MFQETFIVQLPDLCPLSMYAFVHVYTILTLGRSINLYMQGFPRIKHMIFCKMTFPYMNIQDLAKGLLTSVPHFLFVICILMVVEYGVLQHARQSRFGTEGILEYYAVSVRLHMGII
jgi:hypothetical protein